MSVPVTFPGGEGELLELDGENLRCTLSRAFAPGAPVDLSVPVGNAASLLLQTKARRSVREGDARFLVNLRLVSLRRHDRETLERALQD